jgi:Fur family zinc uptake transcriptional regulator
VTQQHSGSAHPGSGPDHDHGACIAAALASAESTCARDRLRLTDIRRRVLALVWRSHAPIKAYDILTALGPTLGRVAPPTVYRALDFLIEAGLVHRVASENAYVGCPHPERRHRCQLLVCEACGNVTELADAATWEAIALAAAGVGFEPRASTLEVHGLCAACRRTGAGSMSSPAPDAGEPHQ